MLSSDRDSFLEKAANGANFIPLTHSWPADLETPLSTWLKVGQEQPPGVLLESVEGGETLGRWSVVASEPLWVATANGDSLIRNWRDGQSEELVGNPFDVLRQWLAPYRSEKIVDLPSLGQLYGVWSYELIKWIEPSVSVYSRGVKDPPDGVWMFMDRVIIFDQVKRLIHAVAYADLTNNESPIDAYQEALQRSKDLEILLEAPLPSINPLRWKSKADIPNSIKSNYLSFNQFIL